MLDGSPQASFWGPHNPWGNGYGYISGFTQDLIWAQWKVYVQSLGAWKGRAAFLEQQALWWNMLVTLILGQNCSLGSFAKVTSFVIEGWLPRSSLQRQMILITLSCVGKVQGQTWETMRRSWPWTWPPMLPVPHSWKRSREQVFVLSHSLVVLMTET